MPPIKSKTERQDLNGSQYRLVESIISTIEDFMDHAGCGATRAWIIPADLLGGYPDLPIREAISARYTAAGYQVAWGHHGHGDYVKIS